MCRHCRVKPPHAARLRWAVAKVLVQALLARSVGEMMACLPCWAQGKQVTVCQPLWGARTLQSAC